MRLWPLAILLLVSCSPVEKSAPDQTQYNLVLISIDTLRADHLGCYGYDENTSPNIDQLARGGIVFDDMISQAPVTTPSHMTMFTSTYPSVHGMLNFGSLAHPEEMEQQSLSPDLITLPQILQEKGYDTAGFAGKGTMHGPLGFDRGFDLFEQEDLISYIQAPGPIQESTLFDWLDNRTSQPFFLFIHTFAVHQPYISPDYGYFIDYLSDSIVTTKGDYAHLTKEANSAGEGWNTAVENIERRDSLYLAGIDKESDDDIAYLEDLYDGCIHYTDRVLAEVFAKMGAKGLLNDTIIVITSDHGEEFMEHGSLGHHSLYNEHLHVPLIIVHPAMPAGRVSGSAGLIDLAPTLLDIMGIEIPPTFQGRSLADAIEAGVVSESAVFSETYYPDDSTMMLSLLSGNGKYIWQAVGNASINMFFNLSDDPREQDNIYTRGRCERYRNATLEWSKENRYISQGISRNGTVQLSPEGIDMIRTLGYIN